MPIHVSKWLAGRGRRSHPIRRRAKANRPLTASERLEPRAMMAADPQVVWSSYLGNAGNQTIEGAWVAPDDVRVVDVVDVEEVERGVVVHRVVQPPAAEGETRDGLVRMDGHQVELDRRGWPAVHPSDRSWTRTRCP